MKRILSLLLALSLMVSLLAVGISASSENPTIVSAVAINDTQFKITTSEPITVLNAGCFALYVAKNGVVQNLDERDGRFGGTISPSGTAATEFVWTINSGNNATNVITSAVAAGHKVYFGMNGTNNSGMLDTGRVQDEQGKGFVPNLLDYHTSHDIYGVDVKAFAPLTILYAKAIGDYQIEIKFSEDLRVEDNGGTPWVLSQIDSTVLAGLVLVSHEKDPSTGYYLREKEFSVGGTMALGNTNDTLIWTITDQNSGTSIFNILNTWPKAGYSVKFAFKDNNCGWHGAGYIGAIQATKYSTTEKALSIPDEYTRVNSGSNEYIFVDIKSSDEGGLVAHWDFENVSGTTLKEVTGNVEDGTINGGASTVAVKEGYALKLDGIDDSVNVPYHEDLKFEKTDNFSVSLWFNVDENISSGWHMLAGMGRSSGVAWYGFYLSADGTLYWSAQNNPNAEPSGSFDQHAIATPTPGTWNFVTAVHDGVNGCNRYYYNGVYVKTVTANSNMASGTADFTMGYSGVLSNGTNIGEYFMGQLDNIRVYDCTMTDQEICNLYDSEKSQYVEKAYMDWDEEWPALGASVDDPVNIIYDTDMGPDCDDAGALAILHAYADQGLANILACVCDTSNQWGAPCIDAINTYYGRPDIPVGTLKSKSTIAPNDCKFNRYIAQMYENDTYNGYLAADAVDVYREALAKAEDNSVVIVVVGMQTNLMDLLRSEPDEYSNLSGIDLVKKKVKMVSAMAGGYPAIASECNIYNDLEAATYVADKWPTPIMYSGFEIGISIQHAAVRTQMEEDNPVRKSYDLWRGDTSGSHASFDLTSVLYAVEGLGEYWTMQRANVEIVGLGTTAVADDNSARAYLVKKMSPTLVGNRLDSLLLSASKNNLDEPAVSFVDVAPDVDGVTLDGTFSNDVNKAALVYNQTIYSSSTAEDAVSIEFTGTGIDVFGGYGKDGGMIQIYIDGRLVKTVDTYHANNIASAPLYSVTGLRNAEHTLKVQNSGTGNNASVGTTMSLDYCKVYSGSLIDADGEIKDLQAKIDGAVQAGQTEFYLNADAVCDELNVPSGMTLDLNGHVLVADIVIANGEIRDSSEGMGGIVMAKNDTNDNTHLLEVQAGNAMMALYDTAFGGYRFFTVTVNQLQKANASVFGFQFDMNERGLALLKDAANADVELVTRLVVTADGQEVLTKDYVFKAATVADYATKKLAEPSRNWAIVLTVSGFEKLSGNSITMTSTPGFRSSTGAAVAPLTNVTVTYTYNK